MPFARPSLGDLVTRIRSDLRGRLEILGPLLRRAMADVLGAVLGGVVHELYGYLGVESSAIGNLEQLLPGDPNVALLRQYNASNNGLLGIGTPDLKGTQPLKLYDQLTADVLGQIDTALALGRAHTDQFIVQQVVHRFSPTRNGCS